MKGHFEAKKHAIRQTQDGWVVSFVIHPNDVAPDFAAAPLGTIFMVGYQTTEDAEEAPVASPPRDPERSQRAQQQYQHKSDAEQAVTRAAMLCQDPEFQLWLLRNQPGYSRDNWLPISAEAKEDHTKTILRNTLQCASRSEIATSRTRSASCDSCSITTITRPPAKLPAIC